MSRNPLSSGPPGKIYVLADCPAPVPFLTGSAASACARLSQGGWMPRNASSPGTGTGEGLRSQAQGEGAVAAGERSRLHLPTSTVIPIPRGTPFAGASGVLCIQGG